MRQCGKYFSVGQATSDSSAHAHFVLDTKSYKHTLGIRNTHCFSSNSGCTKHLNIAFIRTLPIVLVTLPASYVRLRQVSQIRVSPVHFLCPETQLVYFIVNLLLVIIF